MSDKAIKRIYEALKNELDKSGNSLIYGTVVSTNPLSVRIENNITLPASFLVVANHLRERQYKYITDAGGNRHIYLSDKHLKPEHQEYETRLMTFYEGLEDGERVVLLSFNNGQKFYIAERA